MQRALDDKDDTLRGERQDRKYEVQRLGCHIASLSQVTAVDRRLIAPDGHRCPR